jgi:hypothetical protein
MTVSDGTSLKALHVVLTGIWWLALIVGILLAIGIVSGQGYASQNVPVSFAIDNPSFSLNWASRGGPQPQLTDTTGTVEIDLDIGRRWWLVCSLVLSYLGGLYILHQARLLVRSARDHAAFSTTNVWRLRAIGFLVLVGVVVRPLAAWLSYRWLVREVVPSGIRLGVEIMPDVGAIILGLALLALAEVFQQGLAQRADPAPKSLAG